MLLRGVDCFAVRWRVNIFDDDSVYLAYFIHVRNEGDLVFVANITMCN